MVAWAIWGNFSAVLNLSHVYRRYRLLNFFSLISLLLWGGGEGAQLRTYKGREKIIFPPYKILPLPLEAHSQIFHNLKGLP